MGFRNPITSLSASQITPGTLPAGVLLAADQIAAGNLDPSVVAAALAPGTVTAPAIATGAVVAGKIAAGAIDAMTIHGNTISGGMISGPLAFPDTSAADGHMWAYESVPGAYTGITEVLELTPPEPLDNGADPGGRPYVQLITRGVGGASPSPTSDVVLIADWIALNGQTAVSVPAILAGETWHLATLDTGAPWATYSAGNETYYVKDAAGRVQIRGLVKNGYFGTTIFTLPPGYRPVFWCITTALVSIDGVEKQIRVDVFPDGRVVCGNGTGTTISYLSLNQLSFPST